MDVGEFVRDGWVVARFGDVRKYCVGTVPILIET